MENKTDKDNFTNELLKKLREQTALTQRRLTKEDEDKKIKNTIRIWWEEMTPEYQKFMYDDYQDRPKSEIEFFAHHLKKAVIGLKEAWEFTQKTLRGRFDVESLEDGEEFHQEFIDEYNRTAYSQKFRNEVINYGIN